MKCPHKNAEAIHAIADGKQTQWARDYNNPIEWNDFDPVWDSSPISSNDGIIWRVKPPEVTQWRKDMAQALKDGKVVEFYGCDEGRYKWVTCTTRIGDFLNSNLHMTPEYYRIKPEPKPDVVMYMGFESNQESSAEYVITTTIPWASNKPKTSSNLKLIWDGETGKLKDSEVLK